MVLDWSSLGTYVVVKRQLKSKKCTAEINTALMYRLKHGESQRPQHVGLNSMKYYAIETNECWNCSSLIGLLSKDKGLAYALRPTCGSQPTSFEPLIE